jgi:DNA-binding NtrC family response regulator
VREDHHAGSPPSAAVPPSADAPTPPGASAARPDADGACGRAAPFATVLVIEDDDAARTQLAEALRRGGHRVETAAPREAALAAVATREFDVVLAGVGAGGADASSLLRDVLDRQPHALVVFASRDGIAPETLERMGADDVAHVRKPASLERLEMILRCALDVRSLRRPDAVGSNPDASFVLSSLNWTMSRAAATARQVAPFDMTVLLTGEGGTGKSALAAAMHNWSWRRAGPFITVSCSGEEPPKRERRRLFRRDAASARDANESDWGTAAHGTLFIDEVGALPAGLQAKLVRFLDEGIPEAKARVIAATSRDLERDVRAGRFRHDLFFRLNVVGIYLPPLRERQEDLPGLSDHILASLCARHRRPPVRLTEEARQALAGYAWPGNLRELVTVLERATVLSRDDAIGLDDLPDRVLASSK